MVCTQALGGMLSVVQAYKQEELFSAWQFRFLWTHQDGTIFTRVLTATKAYFHMLGLLLRGRISFMHVHAAMGGSFWRKSIFVATARFFGVPSIIHLHGSEMKTFYRSLSPYFQSAVRRILEKAEAVVVLSESWKGFVNEIAPRANITVVNNYVALPALKDTNRTTERTGFNVLFLGKLGQRKGVYDLLECWRSVVAEIPDARLLIGGNGEVDLARMRAAKLGVSSSIDFLGWVDGERKLELLKNADAFVLPSYNEGLPMSVLEAMSWGKPVIATRVGGIPELISNGDNGILVDAGDQAQLSAALLRLGHNHKDRDLIGTAARRHIEVGFSDIAVLPHLENVYRQVVLSGKKA